MVVIDSIKTILRTALKVKRDQIINYRYWNPKSDEHVTSEAPIYIEIDRLAG